MKKYLTLGLVAALLLTTALAVVPSTANAQSAGLISSVINRMERNRRDLRSLRSGIIMQKYNAQLRAYDDFHGQVIYTPGTGRNSNVRVDWVRPQQETLAVTNGQYLLYRPRLRVAYTGSANSNNNSRVSGVLGFGLNLTRQQMASQFEPQYLGEGVIAGSNVTHLRLVPRGNAGYKYAEIWVDANGMPLQTRVVERNDDSTTVRLTNPQRNVPVSADEFRLQLPPGVRSVRG